MARKVWMLTLPATYKGPKVDGIDFAIVLDDATAGDNAKVLMDAAYPGYGGAWVAHSVAQDCSVTPAGDAIVAAVKLSSAAPAAVAT